jgi:class 3 adenylate cyclase/DNA-binding SARP family transcriptional activator
MSDCAASPLILCLFGPFEVRVNGVPLPRLRSRKGYWLLVLLTLRAGAEIERAWLAGMLWPDSSEAQALGSLRMSLADLRQALGVEAGRLRSPTPHTLCLDLSGAEADVLAFDAAIARGDVPSLERSVALYRGPLLEGCGEEWAFQERQVREQAYLQALETLAANAIARGDPGAAERHLRLAVAVDPLRESAQRTLMQALAADGNYAAAMLTYRELRLLLHRELNAEPAPETKVLFQQIRAEARHRATTCGAGTPPPPSTLGPTPSVPAPRLATTPLLGPTGTVTFLFTDIEGSTKLWEEHLEAMREALARHDALLRDAIEVHGGTVFKKVGDGFCAAFSTAPEALAAALAAQRALQAEPWETTGPLRVRMALHTGVAREREGDYLGPTLNRVARLLKAGHGGQILLSQSSYDLARDLLPEGTGLLDLGEHHLKDLIRPERVFQAVHPELPAAFPALRSKGADERQDVSRERPAAGPQPSDSSPSGASDARRPAPARETQSASAGGGSSEGAPHVVLLYKRKAQPDERLLKLLETQLTARGYQVFIDRHMTIGEDWAREIRHQVRTASAVVPLLSEASVQSEMLEYELQIAHQAAQQQEGKPRLLPIRINYTNPLPERLAPILGPLHYTLWEGAQDDERLVEELLNALGRPPAPRPPDPPGKLEAVRGAVPLGSPFYVERPTDAEFLSAIARHASIVLVKGPRQMGKTSLLARGLQQAREAGDRVVQTDLQMLNAAHLASAETLYLTLAGWMADQLELDVFLDQVWTPRRGASGNFTWYLQREVLSKIAAPIVWGLDEVDVLIPREFGSEVFGLFRSWHNQRALDPTGRWARFTLAIAYATEPHLFIQNLHQSPFNVGTPVTLKEFSFEETAELNQRYGCPLQERLEVERYVRLVSGHPYLVHRGLQEMVKQGLGISDFEAQADRDDGLFGDHLKRLLMLLVGNPPLCDEVREVLRGRPCPSVDGFHRLRSAGVLGGDSPREARLRCPLYAIYLERYLL